MKAGVNFKTEIIGPIKTLILFYGVSFIFPACPAVHIEVDPSKKYQFVEGFGGAVTDAAGINWKNLSKPLQKLLVEFVRYTKNHRQNI